MSVNHFKNISFCFLFFISFNLQSQSWLEAMNGNNFNEAKRLFYEYWKNKPIQKGHGYKTFKRWEWYWENRVNVNGTFPQSGATMQAYENYKSRHPQAANRAANWTSLGPVSSPGGYAGIGRVNSVAFHPTNTSVIYVGTSGGGLWQSNNGGNTWFTNTDNIGSLGVSSIAINPINPLEIYIATGDADGNDNFSIGILKSTDGGITFAPTGLNWTTSQSSQISKLVFAPNNTQVLIAATSNGIYRTLDGGVNWTQVNASTNYKDLEVKTNNNTSTYYASRGSIIMRSTNGGATWSTVQTISGASRIALGVSPADSNYVYALCANSSGAFLGLYRSTTSGSLSSFTSMSSTPNILGYEENGSGTNGQGTYDLVIAIDPTNKDIVHIGGVNHWKSINGGSTWQIKSIWSSNSATPEVHADKHALEWQGNILYEGNDGGLYNTSNGGDTWTFKSVGIVNSQMYKLGISEMDGKIITGLQDNGTKQLTGTVWEDVLGGDGMECAVQTNDADVLYGSIYYGDFSKSTDGGFTWNDISNGLPAGNWITPFIIDPQMPSTIYAGYASMYKSTDQGSTWAALGASLGGNQNFTAVAPSNTNYIYSGRAAASTLRKSINGGTSWTTITDPGAGKTAIAINPKNPEHLFITRSNYNTATKVYESTNGGSTWTDISGTLPAIPANTIVYQEGGADGIYVGMDVGIYYKDDNLSDWILYNTGLPNVEITELEIDNDEGKLYAATYGRGLWSSDLYSPIICNKPKGLFVDTVTNVAATFHWAPPNIVPSNGYEINSNNVSGTLPTSGTAILSLVYNFTGLTPTTNYYFYARSVCGSDKSEWAIYGPVKTEDICPKPQNVVVADIRTTQASFTWTTIGIPTGGMEYAVTSTATPPTTGTSIGGTNVTVVGLTSNTNYYFHLRSNCSGLGNSVWITKAFTTSYTCGTTIYDSGGSAATYSANENIVRNICPSQSGEVVTLTFATFGVEESWDALYLFDGSTVNAPKISSGNPVTDAGFPAGGYYGSTIPGPFTANNSSGCLTTHFLSDGFVNELGWDATITCNNVCSSIVSNKNDDGLGSLRFNSNCAGANTTLSFSPTLINDTIKLSSTIVLDKNIVLSNTTGGNIYIKIIGGGPIFKINTGAEVAITNINLIGGSATQNRAITNDGTCTLTNVKIQNSISNTPGSLINNRGVMNVDGVVEVRE